MPRPRRALVPMWPLAIGLAVFGPARRAQASAPGPLLDIYDGFETPRLSRLWATDRFAPGAVEMQSAIVRAGHGAVRITLHSHDVFEAKQGSDNSTERDELREAEAVGTRDDTPYEVSWSMYLPADFPIVPVRLVIAQWKQYSASNDNPVLALRYVGGVLSITQNLVHRRTVLYKETRDLRGHWLDIRFQVRLTEKPTGFVRAWLDGRQVVDHPGLTANPASMSPVQPAPKGFYFKMGLYRDVMAQPMVAYFDEYRKRQLP